MQLNDILKFIHEIEQLKMEGRHSWLSNGQQESVAEHTWRIAMLAFLLAPHLQHNVDLLKVLKMCLIHDINEAYIGDVPAFANHLPEHRTLELANMRDLLERFPGKAMGEISDLWLEFEAGISNEAKFVNALNKIEIRIQHNEAHIDTWNDIEFPRSLYAADNASAFDEAIMQFNELVKEESRQKIVSQSDRDIQIVENLAKQMSNK